MSGIFFHRYYRGQFARRRRVVEREVAVLLEQRRQAEREERLAPAIAITRKAAA